MSFFDQFEVVEEEPVNKNIDQNIPTQIQQSNNNSEDFFSQFESAEEPSTIEKGATSLAKVLSRALSSTYGLPGDIESLIRPIIAEHQGEGGGLIGQISEKRVLPTSSELKELQKEKYGKKFEPEGKVEEFFGNVAEDFALNPGGPVKKLALATLGEGASELVKLFGGSDEAQTKAKIASTFLGSFAGKKNVKDYYQQQYKNAEKAIPEGANISAKNLSASLDKIEKEMNKGISVSSKDPAKKSINEIKEKIQNGEISVESLDQIYHEINEMIFDIADKETKKKAKYWVDKVKDSVSGELSDYGKTNKEFYKHFIDANAAFKGLKDSQKASNAIGKWKKAAAIGSPIALTLELVFGGPEVAIGTAAAGGTALGLVKGYELQKRIFANPTLFKYYSNALKAAANENKGQFFKNVNKLTKNLEEENLESSRFADLVRESRKKS